MNILYGVQATGNGHINRSREFITELKKRGHSVLTLFSGRDRRDFWSVGEFFPYIIFDGLTFKVVDGSVKYFKTLTSLNFSKFYNDINWIASTYHKFDVVISDYEPISSRVAKKRNIQSINLSHQASFNYKNVPIKFTDPISYFVLKNFARCDVNIGVHWDNFGSDFIIPPSLPELTSNTVKNKYVVYLPFENIKELEYIFKSFTDKQFYVYKKNYTESKGNIIYKPFSRMGFIEDLQEAEGVICNAGFQLVSECLQMGKKILVKPLKKQIEQVSNVLCINKLGIGNTTGEITLKSVEKYLYSYNSKKISFPNTAKIFVDWLEEDDILDVSKLSKICWSKGELS